MPKPPKKEIISTALESLRTLGYGRLRSLLEPEECRRLREPYRDQSFFRSRVEMERYRFGRGEYRIQISAARISTGEAVVITTRYRPVEGARGFYRTNFRHGVSPIYGGERYTLGIIFHDSV